MMKEALLERRVNPRFLAFCEVLDNNRQILGITFNLSREGICLTLPNTFSTETEFSIILSPNHDEIIPDVRLKIQPLWRRKNCSQYDEVGGLILEVFSKEAFETLLDYYHLNGPSGLYLEFIGV